MSDKQPATLFPAFAAVGAVGFVVDAAMFQLLFSATGGFVLPRLLATATAIVVTWYLNRRFVFRTTHTPGRFAEFLKYLAVQSGGIVTNLTVYAILLYAFASLRDIPIVAVAIGALFALGMNFFGSRRWAFAAAYEHPKEPEHE